MSTQKQVATSLVRPQVLPGFIAHAPSSVRFPDDANYPPHFMSPRRSKESRPTWKSTTDEPRLHTFRQPINSVVLGNSGYGPNLTLVPSSFRANSAGCRAGFAWIEAFCLSIRGFNFLRRVSRKGFGFRPGSQNINEFYLGYAFATVR
jgi:hypothetical protein